MASIIESYNRFMKENSDPRTESYWMMSGPGPLIVLLLTYLYICRRAGPDFMRDRKPYNLKNTILLYNASQVAFSIFIVWEGLQAGWLSEYSFACQPVDYSDSPMARRMADAVWWYFFCKIIELADTIFFVLRKNNRQITFLHLFHHTIMPICGWIGAKFLPGGHGTLLGVINSAIHVVMYSYYFLSCLGPQYQKYVWWKPYLTIAQMIQFVIIFYHNFQVMFIDCNYPKGINALLFINASVFLYMFGSFFIKTYARKQTKVEVNGAVEMKSLNGYAKESNGINGIDRNGAQHNGVKGPSNGFTKTKES